MGQVFLMGLPEDLGQLGDAGIPYTPPRVQTLAQARALERQLMAQQARKTSASGFVENLTTGIDTLGDQIVRVLDAGARVKVAAKTAKARVKQGTKPILEDPMPPDPMPSPNYTPLLVLGAVVLGGVLLLRRP